LDHIIAELVRDPSRRTSSQSCTGEFRSLTTGERLVFESAGERDLLIMLDVDYRTVEIAPQPERFQLKLANRSTTYVPDVFAASLSGERCYFQVKPGHRLDRDPTLKGRLEAIEEYCRQRGAIHRCCPSDGLKPGHRLQNSRWVHAAATCISLDEVRLVHRLLARMRPPATIGELQAEGLTAVLRDCLMGLVGEREVFMPLGSKIDATTEVIW